MSVRGCERGPGPRRGAIGPKFPHVMAGGGGGREPALPAAAPPRPAPAAAPARCLRGKGTASTGPSAAVAARRCPRPSDVSSATRRLPKSSHPPPALRALRRRRSGNPGFRIGLGPLEGAGLRESGREVSAREAFSLGLTLCLGGEAPPARRRALADAALGCPTCLSCQQAPARSKEEEMPPSQPMLVLPLMLTPAKLN
ncbi:atherin-like [Aquila chrysaetos chrysaetos]|uniref:atherin-like n=1 Tax=Aquila chrysaetos chrysaetos TaxID=223781 RepID=UPI001176D6BA|nr:atherin-like [Aquila chrysaetos chrysaetos]